MLAERVKAGLLPPVAERLPPDPVVVPPVHEIGRYGGSLRRLGITPNDSLMLTRLGYEPIVRWDREGQRVVPGLAESWEVLNEGRTYIFHLRKGIRWSDGHPFTSADFSFWYEDIALNRDITPVPPTWLSMGQEMPALTTPDPYTVRFDFANPNGIFPEVLAFRGHYIFTPRHYLEQFHPRYGDPVALDRLARKEGYSHWAQRFDAKADLHDNPDLPTIRPWKIVVPPPSMRLVCERNPYYWKVDPEGRQLPYIDRIVITLVQNQEVLNLKAMTGQTDLQDRYIDTLKYTLFMENRAAGNYRVMKTLSDGSLCVYLNQHSKDPVLRGLLKDRRFRIALSVAVNRKEIVDLAYSGLAVPSRAVSDPRDVFYLPEYDALYLDHDPVLVNRLLDEVGLKRGADGMRRFPGGAPFRQILNCYPSEAGTSPDMWQLVVDAWRDVGLDFVMKTDAASLSRLQVINGNSDFWAYATTGMLWIVDPTWYVPCQEGSYFAPLYARYIARRGRAGVEPPPEIRRLADWYRDLTQTVSDGPRRLELGRRILSQWAEECYTVGIVRPFYLMIVSNRFRNMPDQVSLSYRLMSPGYVGLEQCWIEEGE